MPDTPVDRGPAAGGQAPLLVGAAADAVSHRGSNLTIIATAGSGKTEVISQRVASLIDDGVEPSAIVAFTFTRKAAAELKERIAQRVVARLGENALGPLSRCYVGTIHAYALQLLREVDARFEDYDLIDDIQLAAFLTKERSRIGYDSLHTQFYGAIEVFRQNLNVVEAELIDPESIGNDFGQALEKFYDTLDRHKLLTFGRSIALCVESLQNPVIEKRNRGRIKHLVIDEYQDVDPAQEFLIGELHRLGAQLCVVGDDDQSIYQWRGASVGNIVSFPERYPDVAAFDLVDNRRSRPGIVESASHLASTIEGRIDKDVASVRDPSGATEIVAWRCQTELDEASQIADSIERLHDIGYAYSSMAILMRSRTPLKKLAPILRDRGIPMTLISSGTVLETPIGEAAGKMFAWLGGVDWRIGGPPVDLSLDDVVDALQVVFPSVQTDIVRSQIQEWYDDREWGLADFVGDLYKVLELCGVKSLSLSEPNDVAVLANLGQFTKLLTDFERIYRRARIDANGEYHGARPSGETMYRWLAIHMTNIAQSEYAALTGEPVVDVDAVTISTIHAAKGLEWPIVFVPSLTKARFAFKSRGLPWWRLPADAAAFNRYAGSDADERRIFYVAMTRARDWLSLSAHRTPNVRNVALSPFMDTMMSGGLDLIEDPVDLPLPQFPSGDHTPTEPPEVLSLSQLLSYSHCGTAYWFREVLNLQPPLAREIGYGKAVHHVLRLVAETVIAGGVVPTSSQIDDLIEAEFYIPFANSRLRAEMAANAARFVHRYVDDWSDELRRVWAVERSFEMRSASVSIAGRADVIVKVNDDHEIDELSIVDYKTAHLGDHSALQVQAYVGAARDEGLDVVSGFVHNLRNAARDDVDTSPGIVDQTMEMLFEMADGIVHQEFVPNPGDACERCDVRLVCPHSAHIQTSSRVKQSWRKRFRRSQ